MTTVRPQLHNIGSQISTGSVDLPSPVQQHAVENYQHTGLDSLEQTQSTHEVGSEGTPDNSRQISCKPGSSSDRKTIFRINPQEASVVRRETVRNIRGPLYDSYPTGTLRSSRANSSVDATAV
nr:uncharacterized protein LOC115255907 [Aedes albopictus]